MHRYWVNIHPLSVFANSKNEASEKAVRMIYDQPGRIEIDEIEEDYEE